MRVIMKMARAAMARFGRVGIGDCLYVVDILDTGAVIESDRPDRCR